MLYIVGSIVHLTHDYRSESERADYMALYRWKPLETVTFAGGTIARRQNRVLEYRSKFIIRREYDHATRICGTEVHRGTRYVGTYEYNPVNERVGGGGVGRGRATGWARASARCGVDAPCLAHPDQIRRVPPAKIRGRGL